jgi:hypothetical protein
MRRITALISIFMLFAGCHEADRTEATRSFTNTQAQIMPSADLTSEALAPLYLRLDAAARKEEQELAEKFAPLLLLHPEEDCFPMNASEFLGASRFRHFRKGAKDQGFNRQTQQWDTNDSHDAKYYGIPVTIIAQFGLHPNGKNRRPRDDNSGHDVDVFVQPDGTPAGNKNFNGQVPVFYYLKGALPNLEIQYWFFYGYNRGFNEGLLHFNHQGDWEHVRVEVVNGAVQSVKLSAHGEKKEIPVANLPQRNGRFAVYVARGTHALYESTGEHHYANAGPIKLKDHTADRGAVWDTKLRLERLDEQPWREYAGAWGEVGETSDTTGPLGPWHKLD